jgi:hypothetical protein
MKKIFPIFILVLLLVYAVPAYSAKGDSDTLQKGDFGLNFYSGAFLGDGSFIGNEASIFRTFGISAISHLTSSFAIEPGIFFKKYDQEYENGGTTYNKLYLGASIGLFYYSNLKNNMYLYTGPRIEYAYGKQKESGTSTDKSTLHSIGTSAILGLKYMIGSRFGVFADIGLGFFITKENDSSGTHGKETTTSISLSRGIFGAVFYF